MDHVPVKEVTHKFCKSRMICQYAWILRAEIKRAVVAWGPRYNDGDNESERGVSGPFSIHLPVVLSGIYCCTYFILSATVMLCYLLYIAFLV